MEPMLLLLLMVVLLAVPLWQTFRQNKKIREIRAMQDRVAPGERVQTGAGVHGRIVAVGETTVDLEIADGVVTTWERAAILRNLSREAEAAEGPAQPAPEAPEAPADGA